MLFDFDLGTSSFELLLDLFCFCFWHASLDGGTALVDKRLRFCEAETCHDGADLLDDSDFLSTTVDEDNVELGLFFNCWSSGSTASTTASGGNGYRSSSGNAPLLFQSFYQFCDLKHCQSAKFIYDFTNVSHVI